MVAIKLFSLQFDTSIDDLWVRFSVSFLLHTIIFVNCLHGFYQDFSSSSESEKSRHVSLLWLLLLFCHWCNLLVLVWRSSLLTIFDMTPRRLIVSQFVFLIFSSLTIFWTAVFGLRGHTSI